MHPAEGKRFFHGLHLLNVGPMDRFHVLSMAQDKFNIFLDTQIS